MGVRSLEEYNQKLVSLIRRAGREVYLGIENKEYPYPQVIFHDAHTGEVAVINLKGQRIATFIRFRGNNFERFIKKYDAIYCVPKSRDIQKWINYTHIS
jgi:hypothetical protein